jgi:transposase InsO family protein
MGTGVCRRQRDAVRTIAVCVVGDGAPTALDRRRREARHGTSILKPGAYSPAVAHGDAMSDSLVPRDHAEAVALFRATVIGALTRSELDRGELAAELRKLAERKYRPPGRRTTKQYGVSTLERWYSAYRRGGLAALRPDARSDSGKARELSPEQRALLLDIRREHPGASAALILRTLVNDGRLAKGVVSTSTLVRFYRAATLPRGVRPSGHTRLRWQAERPGALWHGDVCHGPALRVGQTTKPVRIHALLDDASRYVVALEARHTEREDDMLDLMLGALRRHGAPDALYLDNGATYRGDVLRLASERLAITLIHARPYDAPARGKMERLYAEVGIMRSRRSSWTRFAGWDSA